MVLILKGGDSVKSFYVTVGMLAALSIGSIIFSNTGIEESITNIVTPQDNTKVTSNNINRLYNNSVKSVLAIYTDSKNKSAGASGTGFVVNYNNEQFVVTNEHVVPSKKMVYTLINNKKEKFEAKTVYSNTDDDIAFLKLKEKVDIPGLEIKLSSRGTSIGQSVYTIGNPYDFLFSFSNGIISNIDKNVIFQSGDYDETLLQTNINVNPGNSGGPLLNQQGEVIGIISSMLEDSTGISFAVPSEFILKHLEKMSR